MQPVPLAVAAAGVAALVLAVLPLPLRAYVVLLMAALVTQLVIVNGAAESAYFATAKQGWEQGQFIHFFGLTQWLAWLWPFLTLVYLLMRLFASPSGAAPGGPLKSVHE